MEKNPDTLILFPSDKKHSSSSHKSSESSSADEKSKHRKDSNYKRQDSSASSAAAATPTDKKEKEKRISEKLEEKVSPGLFFFVLFPQGPNHIRTQEFSEISSQILKKLKEFSKLIY